MADSHNIKPNKATYGGFISMIKWSLPIIAVAVFIIILLIS